MNNKFFLTMLLTMFTLILCGCGTENGITQPTSIQSTPTLNNILPNTTTTDRIAYILIRVKWPQRGEAGNYTISSANDSLITNRMPSDTKRIDIKILEYNDPNNILGQTSIKDPNTTGEIQVKFGDPNDPNSPNQAQPIPVVKVKIKAEAYDPNNSLLSEAEKEIKVGQNQIVLDLGHYDFTLTLDPNTIAVNEDATLTGEFKILYDTPSDSNETQPTPMPFTNKEITFSIDPNSVGSVEFKTDNTTSTTATVITDPNGQCNIKLIGKNQGDVTVIAKTNPTDPNSFQVTCKIKIDGVLLWKDDFESYTVGTWPDTWTKYGSATEPRYANYIANIYSYNDTPTNVLLLTGGNSVSGALRALDPNGTITPPYQIDFKIMQAWDTDRILGRARIGIRKDSQYASLSKDYLLGFWRSGYQYGVLYGYSCLDPNNTISYGGKYLGKFFTMWYSVKIRVTEIETLLWFNPMPYEPTQNLPYHDRPPKDNYPLLTIDAPWDCRVWYDDIKVYSVPPSEF